MTIIAGSRWLQLFIIIFFVTITTQEITQECGRTKCKIEGIPKFKYNVGTIYRYHHSVNVSLNLGNASTASNLFITSLVEIEFTTPCEADLRISDAGISQRVKSEDESKYSDRTETKFKEHLEEYSLRFAFEDGHVREVCPHSQDPVWSVNIKRGILSMLQNTMKRFDVDHHTNELDVNGICDTHYRLHEARKTSLIVTKAKDLDSCSNRGKHLSIIQSTGYTSPRKHSKNSLLDSNLNCEIVIDHNIYESVYCKESHTLKALSNRDAAVKSTVNSALTLIEEINKEDVFEDEEETIDYSNIVPTNLLYDHSSETSSGKTSYSELRTSRDLLKSMCLLGSSGQLEQQFSELFTKFIHSARLLDYASLSALLKRADGICVGGRKRLLDALPFIGTGSSLKVMRDTMSKKMVDKDTSDKWVTAIALVPRPDASTVAALLSLLELEGDMPDAHLTLVYSAVVRAFCQNDAVMNKWRRREQGGFFQTDDCLSIEGTGINKFLARLEDTIDRGCNPRPHNPEENRKTLEALKAIGNMGLETRGILRKLETCVNDVSGFLPMEIKISAIEAHRRLPSCQDTRDKMFLELYRNVTHDPEIRIASYLQVMRCPDYTVIKTIKGILREEPVNQVGSFVWSHLTNLHASSSPTRIEIQSLLTDRDLGDKFNSDARKYSRNYESSFFSEEYNVGGTFQSNVVFSSKSYIPRTLTFNVSLDLFGESVHVFEATVRMEGMEYYAEKFFGPDGPLAKDKISQHIASFLRKIRSPEDMSALWDGIKRLPNIIDNNFGDPTISVSYKIFGNELDFRTLRGKDEIAKNIFALDPWSKILKLFSGKEIRYENSAMFLDFSYIVSSTAGLPVRLDLTGSAACNLKLSGLLEAGQSSGRTDIQFAGNLSPSVSVDVTGKMTVDAFYKSAAIKLRSNIYTSSAVRLKLEVKGMELIRLNVGLPNRKLEVFSMRTDILLVSGNEATTTETSAIGSLRHQPVYFANTTCSWPVLERLIGLKLCLDYQFPNTTEITDASYLLLNGPTLLRTSIIKADPTAESYLFEYKWNASPTESTIKLAFDTPGSKIHREASAVLTFDAPTRNVSLLLSSAGNSLVAKGTYKRTDDEAMVDVGLDVNGTKHLQGYMGYTRTKGNYGYTYNPKMYLAINGERVAELQGTIRDAHKNNVSQCDIDLTFETKRVKSRVMGYVMTRETSLTGNVKLEYQFQPSKKNETLQVEISLANRSTKTLTHKEANLKIQSSAYPQLNAIINSWYQQALGHLELHLEINGKPHLRDDRHKLTAQLVLTHSKAYFQSDESKINAYFALRKPIQNLDIKIGIQRFSIGPSSKTYFLVRYAPGKEITLAVNLITPRGNMYAVEAHVNMTIPNLVPLVIDLKINEKARREYDIDFAGTWFSGHNGTIRGTYADRSSGVPGMAGAPRIVSHSLKLLVRSPSLERDVLINCKLYRDLIDVKLDVNVEYLDADKYAIMFEHSQVHLGKFTTSAEARYKNNVYGVTANFDVQGEIRMEIHLDRWRDVHLVLTGINQETNKEFGVEVRWDANRDPDLKFAALLRLAKQYEDLGVSYSRNLTAFAMVTYPGRLFTTSGLLAMINGNNYIIDGKIVWDPESIIQLGIDIDFDPENWRKSAKFDGQVLTPFEGWRKTSLNSRYNWTEKTIAMNCDAHWQDNEKVLVHLLASYEPLEGGDEYKADCGLISTIHNIGWMTANVTHKLWRTSQTSNMDSTILLRYNPDNVVDVKSNWSIEGPSNIGDNITVTGNLQFASPIVNYKNGNIKCQLRWEPNWKFGGASSAEIDLRKYTGILRGDLARIKESMIEFNLTSPLEKYRLVTGRFGISERNRHVVAEVVSPSGPIGIEALCQLFTTTNNDFNVVMKVSTPIELLQRFWIIAKMARTEADFRLAYNNITAGFQAVWHYNNITDFHYSYIIFTPIHGLHESGIVAKLIVPGLNGQTSKKYAIDTEFSVRIVERKVGLRAISGPRITARGMELLTDPEADDAHKDDFSWHGDAEVHLAVISPITGTLDVDKDGVVYQAAGILGIPNGVIILNDKFTFEDVFDMRNILEVTTPFLWASRISYTYIFKVDMENSVYYMDTQLNVNRVLSINSSYWIETGLTGNYSYAEGDEDDSQNHRLELILKTPLESLKRIDAVGTYEHDENIFRSSIKVRTNESSAHFSSSLEMEENFSDGTFTLGVISPILEIPTTKITVKKDFTEKEKRIEAGIEMEEVKRAPCRVQLAWDITSNHQAMVFVGLETWVESLPSAEFLVEYSNSLAQNKSLRVNTTLKHYPQSEYKVAAVYEPTGHVQINLDGPEDMEYKFDGVVDQSNKITGELRNVKTAVIYRVNGQWNFERGQDNIVTMDTGILLSNDKGEEHHVALTLVREKAGLKFIVTSDRVNAESSLAYINAFNWNISITTSYPRIQSSRNGEMIRYNLQAHSNVQTNGETSLYFRGDTPLRGLESLETSANLLLGSDNGDARIVHQLNDDRYQLDCAWKLAYMIDMLFRVNGLANDRKAGIEVFLRKATTNLNTGFDVNVDGDRWRCATNATVSYRDSENLDGIISVKLPPPDDDNHQILVSYHANGGLRDAKYVVGYTATRAKANYATDGSILFGERNIDGHLRLTWGTYPGEAINNILNATFEGTKIGLKYSLHTPKFIDQETGIIVLNYDGGTSQRSILDADVYYPSATKVGTAHISYDSINNVNGTLNATTSFPRFSYAACDFVVLTTLRRNKRYVKVFWPNDTAHINSDYSYQSERLNSNLEGIVHLEVPLSTRHIAQLNYGYKKRPQVTTGGAQLDYNEERILDANYNSKSESRGGFDKDTIQITLENPYQPLGIDYINQFEYSAGNAGTNYPTLESRRAHVYRLDNSSAFSISGESRIRTTHEGQDIELQAESLNKTVKIRTDYQVIPGEFNHNCRLDLAQDAWMTYRVNIVNKTTEEIDNQFIVIDITYPYRNFTIDGSYMITSHEFNTEGKLFWNKTYPPGEQPFEYEVERTIGAGFEWKNLTENTQGASDRQLLNFTLKHPSLSKDAHLAGYLHRRDGKMLLNATVIVDYSENPDKLGRLSTVIQNDSTSPKDVRYSYLIQGKHPRTRLTLDVTGKITKNSWSLFHTYHNASYFRGFRTEDQGHFYTTIDVPRRQFEFHRESNDVTKHLDFGYYPDHPIYKANGSIVDSVKYLNATGAYYLNIPEKLTWMMVNYTPDAVTSLRMYGNIPDVRNAIFDVWRTYERDLIVNDVSFYLKLNHSRLVTYTLKWRPELKKDIADNIRGAMADFYTEFGKDLDYWKYYIKSESVSAINEIWDDAKDDLRGYINDWENLKELDDDLERLKIYLNDSYNSNDFYIKDLVALGMYVVDELALRKHIESLPNIFNEIWEIMGESGEAIRKSLVWIIEATKDAYKKLCEMVSAVLKGESFSQIAQIIEKMVEKYDKFMKDLHVSFIKYINHLWNNVSIAINRQWNRILEAMEPLFIRVLHYLEAVLWKASKEILDFLYDRRNELIKSPYFDRLANFTQDVDRLYKDIKSNDIITNIRKYSAIIITFLQERYFTMVPFGKELKAIIDEILMELSELKKLPSVHFALDKINYIYERVSYFYKYFGVQAKLERTIKIIHAKLMDVSQSALQAESKYREAKTKFIFDPNIGLMCLEQKLPVSWHAFNQTPEFQEIPEYRAIIDLRDYFTTSNATFWTLYYRFRPYTDPYNLLPPFKAQAMIVGHQHYVTFDNHHYDFVGNGSYLLATDFVASEFAVIICYDTIAESNSTMKHKIIVLCGPQEIEINVFDDTVLVRNSNDSLRLPMELDNAMGFVHQKESIVTIELKNGLFNLKCNLKYDVCVLELAGWYFGKTAGLLGTFNNERYDDTIQSNGIVTSDILAFGNSWRIPEINNSQNNPQPLKNLATTGDADKEALKFCQNIFSNKSSEFGDCFAVVEPTLYATACANSRSVPEACTLAISYMQVCSFYDTYLRIPDTCTSCPMADGSTVPEGEFRKLEGNRVPQSTDVVFIVEAKSCNYDVKHNRSVNTLVNQINKELMDAGLKNNRWALVTFGGNGVYDKPRSLILDNKIFTHDIERFPEYFDTIKTGDGNQDVFGAIVFASQLVFRAGVSKTFILMPCSHCEPQNQTLDYSVINQVLLEHETTLHILMDGDFHFSKQRLSKIFYGLDATKSYTRKDVKVLRGDVDLRRQVKMSKNTLGYCTPLALESNGTIFSGNKLRFEKSTAIKKFTSVFAKRVAATALPSHCQHCECTADNDGVTHMECIPCVYPMPTYVDYETFNEDDTLSVLQPMDADYVQIDDAED
ncbi:uncharacterized protein Apoltp isoform X2 [Fopius arisanus]|uniref:Uncharacterized protein Apoltp isoform X2 n=1 Tax=Fopius arisanus TaxID=64838 RepID=A0A9R1U606_9HYME|nr:PREDICTED: uncharacterized protein LOC105269669 isoform X2 [Fopius arisanus]